MVLNCCNIYFTHFLDLKVGAKLSGARIFRFKHNDLVHASHLLKLHGPGVICVETVYSNDGSVCPLKDFVELTEKFDSVIVVDESHSVGCHGPDGAGIVVELGLEKRVHFRTFSLAKAFAGKFDTKQFKIN